MRALILAAVLSGCAAQMAHSDASFTVALTLVADEKAVFATVESINVVPARARIGGTVAELKVKEGDRVGAGQIVATIGDEKLVLQMKALDGWSVQSGGRRKSAGQGADCCAPSLHRALAAVLRSRGRALPLSRESHVKRGSINIGGNP